MEIHIAGKNFEQLPREQWPCCVEERATFMAPFEMEQTKRHALAEKSPKHYGHFKPTPQRYPAYSAGIVPFLWMMSKNVDEFGDRLELDVDASREPDLGYETGWVHEVQNQTSLLNGFASHLRREDSLCLFYAKYVPFVEGTCRILVGAGRIKEIGPLTEYARSGEGMRGMLWERPVQHSIRPTGQDGFLMPYHELLRRAEENPSLDLSLYTAHAPSEHWGEFSYASELVTHDGAISALLSMDTSLARIQEDLGIATGWQRQWLHDELVRLWKVRGPFPGLGAVLRSFGLSRGLFVAHELQRRVGDNADPWPKVDEAFSDLVGVLPEELRRDIKELAPTWKGLSVQRRNLLRLLSRFELTVDQAKCLYDEASRRTQGWGIADRDLLQNPYRLYECSRHDSSGVQLLTVDRGVFPEDTVRLLYPLEEPSRLDSAVDVRRVRAFTIRVLEETSTAGHTLDFADSLAEAIRNYPVRPECPVTGDILAAGVSEMCSEVVSMKMGGQLVLQLDRYRAIGELVRRQVLGRVSGQRHTISQDWANLLTDRFGEAKDAEERKARDEKAKALAELAESRFSALAGPAGAGKTSVLGILCGLKEVQGDGLLLLAPTGKARVRMQQLAGEAGTGAQTIAQFLNQHGRYDGRSGRYHMSDHPKATGFGTVIIDEASMLTEDMLGALLDALQGVKRLILVGDPAQLPPIGAGRPFVDIIAKLRPADFESLFPRVAPGYAELTIERRQIGAERPDLRLARWFSATSPSAGEDDIFSAGTEKYETLRFVGWEKPEDFQLRLLEVLGEELKLGGSDDQRGFNRALGATNSGEYEYFNSTRNGNLGAVKDVEAWQILSPLRGMPFGVGDINRQIHQRFRAGFMDLASRQRRPIPKPLGAERIVYGDKVINLGNHRRDGRKVYPQEGALGYLANGEIGVVVGQWKKEGYPKSLMVEFSSQMGYTYNFYESDFREEGDAALELAYALTVHKAQGSQFGLVILVLPERHPILSRELIYTALTRHQNRVVVMHQGQRSLLKELSSPHRSETARRRTNLLSDCRMLEFPQQKGNSVFLQEGLIHRASDGRAVRSKSELLIAEALLSAKISFEYEKSLTLGGMTRYPDFTIEGEISGRTVYWEHLGMLSREDYRVSWLKKLEWYRSNGVQPLSERKAGAPILVTTSDSEETGLDMVQVKRLIAEVCGG
ncbi:MAG TPA: AAA family ATPase [Thermoanaerobaculia bacterium]|nr:AAA family ATPase [Thermoanaerobaculia bacterium]